MIESNNKFLINLDKIINIDKSILILYFSRALTLTSSLLLFLFLDNKIFGKFNLFLVSITSISVLFTFGINIFYQKYTIEVLKYKILNVRIIIYLSAIILFVYILGYSLMSLFDKHNLILSNTLLDERLLIYFLAILNSFTLIIQSFINGSGQIRITAHLTLLSSLLILTSLSLLFKNFSYFLILFTVFKIIEFIITVLVCISFLHSRRIILSYEKFSFKEILSTITPAYIGSILIDPIILLVYNMITSLPNGQYKLGVISKIMQVRSFILIPNEVYNKFILVSFYKTMLTNERINLKSPILRTVFLNLISLILLISCYYIFPLFFIKYELSLSLLLIIWINATFIVVNNVLSNNLVVLSKFWNDFFIRLLGAIITVSMFTIFINKFDAVYLFFTVLLVSTGFQTIFYLRKYMK